MKEITEEELAYLSYLREEKVEKGLMREEEIESEIKESEIAFLM